MYFKASSIQDVFSKGHVYKYETSQHVQTTISSPEFAVATLSFSPILLLYILLANQERLAVGTTRKGCEYRFGTVLLMLLIGL